jgi:hypothetical protein
MIEGHDVIMVSVGFTVGFKYILARAENMAQGYHGTFVNRLRERRRQEYLYHFDTMFKHRHFLFLFFVLLSSGHCRHQLVAASCIMSQLQSFERWFQNGGSPVEDSALMLGPQLGTVGVSSLDCRWNITQE